MRYKKHSKKRPLPQKKTARHAAAKVLCILYKEKIAVKPVFGRIIEGNSLAANDRGLAMQLVYGVLRQRQSLDTILEKLSRTPLKKLNPFVHQVIVVALYQIFFLERIPDSAAVNEAVNSCKREKIPQHLHGFVNGVLRQTLRERATLTRLLQKKKSGEPIFNHPEWLVTRWQKNYGAEVTRHICRANSSEPVLTLRINTTRTTVKEYKKLLTAQQIACKPGSYSPVALVLPEFSGPVGTLPGYNDGLFQVQDEAAQLATGLLAPFASGRYLDGCAGLGGKTSYLLELTNPFKTEIYGIEPEQFRIEKLQQNCTRLYGKFPKNLIIRKQSLLDYKMKHSPGFDRILIDAPCSGTGVTGRHPDIRWNRDEEELLKNQKFQLRLLQHAATLLSKNGVLVYATCSLEPEENRQVVEMFLQTNAEFELTDCAPFLPDSAQPFVKDRCFAPLPSQSIDGFFAARLTRKQLITEKTVS